MKQQILNGIRRLANENGGRAPGKGQFHNETQFSESDWYGKIWLRWNDAVEEAGLELRISELPDSDYAKSRTAISVIPGQFGHG
jgi:hypothetical protein